MTTKDLMDRIRGIYVLAVTPMNADLSVDAASLRRNIDHFIGAGAHGIVVGGTYAEYPSLTESERRELFATAAGAVAGRVPLVCCTAASGTAEAVALSQAAKRAGADMVMVTSPYVSEVEPKDIRYHFEILCDAVDIPVMIYNSTSIGVHLSPEQIGELATLKGVAAVKQGGTDIHAQVRTMALAGDKIAVLCGADGTILGAMAVGMPGCSSTVANFMAAEYVALYGEIQAGEWDKARSRFYRWQPVRNFCRKHGQPASTKAALELVGLPSGPVRPPFRSLGDAAKQELRGVLCEAGLLK